MKRTAFLAVLAAAVAALLPAGQSAFAHDNPGRHKDKDKDKDQLVFVQTNEPTGNRIVVYHRGDDGRLTPADTYETGGNGGIATPGTESDRLASQGSLVYDEEHSLLFAVNAGSDTISTFRVRDDRLKLVDIDPSGGGFPASIAVHDDLLYVLNSGGTGIVKGFEIERRGLDPIRRSSRSLGLANADPPDFLTSPGQVGFTPDGRKLIVTTKASGSTIDVFDVNKDGRLSETAVENPSATPVPFAFTFDRRSDRLVVGEAGTSSVTTYEIERDGSLSDPKSLSDGQAALCWIQEVRGFYYVANTASDNLSGYRIGRDGRPSLIGPTGIVATTEAGPIDLTAPSKGNFLYGQTGTAGTVDQYRVNRDGTLTKIGVVTGLPPGQEGIAAT
jgi:6-phosphogluconolactonase (cycloisomerase 2 family)